MDNVINTVSDSQLQKWSDLALFKCLGYLKNETDAQDISQTVMIELLINFKDIRKPESWIRGTARNKCYEFMRKNSAYHKMLQKLHAEAKASADLDIQDFYFKDMISFQKLVTNIPDDYISKKDKDFFMEFINSGLTVKEFCSHDTKEIERVKKQLYTIKRDITAWINKERGVRCGYKRLIGGHLHANILNFFERFRQCVQNNDWTLLKKYFAPGVTIPENFKMKFYEKSTYDVFLKEDNVYRITILYTSGTGEEASGYHMYIRIIPPSKIQLIKFPVPLNKIKTIPASAIPPELKEALTPLPDGTLKYPTKKIMEIAKKYNIKFKTLKPDK